MNVRETFLRSRRSFGDEDLNVLSHSSAGRMFRRFGFTVFMGDFGGFLLIVYIYYSPSLISPSSLTYSPKLTLYSCMIIFTLALVL